MQGRLENKIKREKVIENLLKDMPQYFHLDDYLHKQNALLLIIIRM